MAYFVADEKLQGYYVSGGVTINIVKYHFECDDAASIPLQTAFITSKKVKISMASTAHTIDTDALYKMDSSGAWVQQSQPWKPLADYSVLSNKPQINGHTLTGNLSGADIGLQNVLTFDSTPTQDSTNPVTSGGIWTDQQRLETEIGVVANAGAKNLFAITAQSDIKQGVQFTVNDDGTVTVNRESVGTAGAFFTLGNFTGESGQMYTLSGCPATGTDQTYYMYVGSSYRDYGNGVTREGGTLRSVVIYVDQNYSPDNLTFKPMIRPAAITDPTFQPYAKTNRELTVLTDEDRAALAELVDAGAKNVLQFDAVSRASHNGIDFTLNADGSITVNTSTEALENAYCYLNFDGSNVDVKSVCDGLHVVSGCPINDSGVTLRVMGTGYKTATDSGSGAIISSYSGENVIRVAVYVAKKGMPSNLKVKPMICTAAAWDISHAYQPYRPSWQEMYDMILALQ